MKKESFSLVKEYKNAFNFIRESKKFIYFIILIFFIFFLIGFFVSPFESVRVLIFDYIQELLNSTKGFCFKEMFWFIFSNNFQSSFFGLFFGVLFGIFPLFSSVGNGYLVGFVLSESMIKGGISVALNLLPHGIFELPAIFISLGMGLKLGFWLIFTPLKFYWKTDKKVFFLFVFFYFPALVIAFYKDEKFKKELTRESLKFNQDFYNSIKTFVLIVFPLLLIAALIESALIIF